MKLKGLKAVLGFGLFAVCDMLQAEALEAYVTRPDSSYSWEQAEQKQTDRFTITHLKLVSQTWREHEWTHHIKVVRPKQSRNSRIAFLYLTGDGEGTEQIEMLKLLAEGANAVTAVVTNIPNQPRYEGRAEDALIAYTLDQYLKSGDETWPLLFPMVKSAVRAMDAVQEFSRQHYGQKIDGFVVAGTSKRGWTTWLTAAADSRIRGIVPMVIDMLNVKAQIAWAHKVYGRQSEKIHDYVDLGLTRTDETEDLKKLRGWVDPYSYRERYNMPKLLLLGTNDPYWTVDSLRHYWNDLSQPKLIFQTPNAGHKEWSVEDDAVQSMAAFFQMIADDHKLPRMHWQFKDTNQGKAELVVRVDQLVTNFRLWTADSVDRDFRDDTWASQELEVKPGSSQTLATVTMPREGYRAFLVEAQLNSPAGGAYKLSTEARVIPDNLE